MIQRRTVLAGLAAGAAVPFAVPALAQSSTQSWKAKYPELFYAVVPAENASGVTERFDALRRLSEPGSSAPR